MMALIRGSRSRCEFGILNIFGTSQNPVTALESPCELSPQWKQNLLLHTTTRSNIHTRPFDDSFVNFPVNEEALATFFTLSLGYLMPALNSLISPIWQGFNQRYIQHTKSPYAVTAYGIGIMKVWYASDGICRHVRQKKESYAATACGICRGIRTALCRHMPYAVGKAGFNVRLK